MSDDRKQRIRKAREQAEQVVDRVLAMMVSADADAGWNGNHPLGMFLDFKGFRPESSGFSGFSTVWEDSMVLRDWPGRYHRAHDLLFRLPRDYREALLIDRALRGKIRRLTVGSLQVGVPLDGEAIAQELGISREAWHQRVSRGYKRLIQLAAPQCPETETT